MSVAIKSIQIRPSKNPAKARRVRASVVISPYGVRSLSISPLGLGRLLFPIVAREGLSIRLSTPYRLSDTLPRGVKFVGRSKEAREARAARAAKTKTQLAAHAETQPAETKTAKKKKKQSVAPVETQPAGTTAKKKKKQSVAPVETQPVETQMQFSPPDEITSALFAAEALTTKRRGKTARRKSQVAA